MGRKIGIVFNRILVVIVLFGSHDMAAQYFDGGVQLGVSNYEGEFQDITDIEKIDWTIGFNLKYHLTERLIGRFQFQVANIGSDTSVNQIMPQAVDPSFLPSGNAAVEVTDFETTITMLGLMGEFNIVPFDLESPGFQIVPYIAGGVSAILYSPTTTPNVNSDPQFNLSIPVGAGLKFKVAEGSYISLEGIYHRALTDVLDASSVSAGDDVFATFTVGFNKSFNSGSSGSSVRCPRVIR